MKPIKIVMLLAVIAGVSSGCSERDSAPSHPGGNLNVVEVTARGLEFEAPDEIPSGWATFRLNNESGMIHFAVLQRLPEGIALKDQQEQIAPVFQEGMDLLNAGESDAALEKFGELPEWFGQIVFKSGPGLISAGQTAETFVYLEPGTYLLECYVKTNGIFHSYNSSPSAYGMVHELTVTEESSGAPEPRATLTITLSSERGIEIEEEPTPGKHIVAVHFEDQKVHENFLGHDVHVVRLENDTDIEDLAIWMDWSQPTGLQTPAPAEFLGGTQEMPAGETAYFTVHLEPGRYAWIAEVTSPAEKGMLKTFTVLPEGGRKD
jgi:hypothetical protein